MRSESGMFRLGSRESWPWSIYIGLDLPCRAPFGVPPQRCGEVGHRVLAGTTAAAFTRPPVTSGHWWPLAFHGSRSRCLIGGRPLLSFGLPAKYALIRSTWSRDQSLVLGPSLIGRGSLP